MIQWKSVTVDPVRFERAVKVLIRRLHPTAQGMDGSGGDVGVDIWMQTDHGPVIFEVKSFATRLTPPGGGRSRSHSPPPRSTSRSTGG